MVAAIASQTVQIATRLALAELQLFKPGQTLQAVVAGQAANGLTLLKIGDVMVPAKLPQPAAVGTTLQLEVKSSGSAPQLTIVAQSQPQVAMVAGRPIVMPPPAVLSGLPHPFTPAPTPARQVPMVAPTVPQVTIAESEQAVATVASRNESGVASGRARPDGSAPAPPLPTAPTADGPSIASAGRPALASLSGNAPSEVEARPPVAPTAGPMAAVTNAPAAADTQAARAQRAPVTAIPEQAVGGERATAQSIAVPGPAEPEVSPQLGPIAARPVMAAVPLPGAASGPALAAAVASVPGRTIAVAASPAPVQSTAGPAVAAGEVIEVSPLLVAQEAARPAHAVMPELPMVARPVAPAPKGAPPLPETPAAALSQMMPEAMAKQDSIGPLLRSLAALVAKPTGLPEPILRAAMQVLAARFAVPGEAVSAEAIAKAVGQSGVFLEAGLAKGAPPGADLKAALLSLRGLLGKFLGDVVPAGPAATAERAPPPVRGVTPRAAPVEAPTLPDAPRDIARLVHGQADAAVSRVKLLQLASLPDQQAPQAAKTEFRMELPFLIGHELVMAQIQIARDGGRRESERKRGWSMRFAMHFAATGEVGADVGLLGKTVSVALWAADAEVGNQLGAALPELGAALEAVGLKPGTLHVRRGAPDAESVPSGRLLDSVS